MAIVVFSKEFVWWWLIDGGSGASYKYNMVLPELERADYFDWMEKKTI